MLKALTWMTAWLTCGLQVVAARAADGADASIYLRTNSDCPHAEATWRALQSLLGPQRMQLALGRSTPPWASVVDYGESYEVQFAGKGRLYSDPARNCEKRAQVAAVFVSLRLDAVADADGPNREAPPKRRAKPVRSRRKAPPPRESPPPEPEEPAEPPPPPPRPVPPPAPAAPRDAPPPRRPFWHLMSLSATADTPLDGSSADSPSWGGMASMAMGWGALGGGLSAGLKVPTSLDFAETSVDALRLPVELTLAVRRPGRWRVVAEVGPALDLWRFRGRAPESQVQWRAMLGGVAKLSVGYFGWGGAGPWVSLLVSGFPRAHRFVVEPLGEVGQTRRLWLGARIGAAWDCCVTREAP